MKTKRLQITSFHDGLKQGKKKKRKKKLKKSITCK